MDEAKTMLEKRTRSIAKWLGVFIAPGQVSELRALHLANGKKAETAIFADTRAMAEKALKCEELGAKGIYFTPNPLNPDLLTESRSARKDDVLSRAWLLVDIDPIRPKDASSTVEERASAWEVLTRVRGSLEAAGCTGAVIGDSGNGFHCCFPIDLPNSEIVHDKIKRVLYGLQKRCGDKQAEVDTSTHDAPRIWKIPGLKTRKGTESAERPHRWSSLAEYTLPTPEIRQKNNAAIDRLLMLWDREENLYKKKNDADPSAYAKAALAKEVYAVANCQHHRNNRLNEAAFNLGQLVACGALLETDVEEQLYEAACRCGLDKDEGGPGQIRATIRSGLRSGKEKPRDIKDKQPEPEQPKEPPKNADNSTAPEDQDATAADLIAANATIRWAWEKWIPQGLLSAMAAMPGTGKTRTCMDLARRIYFGLPWPDGAPPTFPPGSVTLWVPADHQHAELATMTKDFGIPPVAVYVNATKKNPFVGTMLDMAADLREFEARIRRVKPAIIFIDTSLNATDKSAHKPEDAKAFFVPLAQICQRTNSCMMCVTHMNTGGTALGKRIEGQCRVVIHMDYPDPSQEHRRAFYVHKTNSLKPKALGITMGTSGNEYDFEPPQPAEGEDEFGQPRPGPQGKTKIDLCCEWLAEFLKHGDRRVSDIRTESDDKQINAKVLYAAKARLNIREYQDERNKKWWSLTTDEPTKSPPETKEDGEIY